MIKAMERKEAKYNFGKINVGTIDPGKCRADHGWDNWQIAFAKNKLNATVGAAGVHISAGPTTVGTTGKSHLPRTS
jgi:hypothetical protein